MKNRVLGVGMIALLCALSMGVSAKSIQEGTMINDNFEVINDHAFDASEDVYVRGIGNFKDPVTVYVTKNRAWACGDDMSKTGYVRKVTGPISRKQVLNLGTFKNGIYDVFVDEDNDGIVDCCIGDGGCGSQRHCIGASNCYDCDDDCLKEIVDGKSFRCFGFEVLPELATSLLLSAGLLSLVGYVAISKP